MISTGYHALFKFGDVLASTEVIRLVSQVEGSALKNWRNLLFKWQHLNKR